MHHFKMFIHGVNAASGQNREQKRSKRRSTAWCSPGRTNAMRSFSRCPMRNLSFEDRRSLHPKCASNFSRSCCRAPPRTSSFTGPHHAASYSSKSPSSASLTLMLPSRRNASIQTDESTKPCMVRRPATPISSLSGPDNQNLPSRNIRPKVPRLFPVDKIPDGERHRRTVFFMAGDFQQVIQCFFV